MTFAGHGPFVAQLKELKLAYDYQVLPGVVDQASLVEFHQVTVHRSGLQLADGLRQIIAHGNDRHVRATGEPLRH